MFGNVLDFSVHVHLFLCVECVYPGITSDWCHAACNCYLISGEPCWVQSQRGLWDIPFCSCPWLYLFQYKLRTNYWRKGSLNPAELTTEHYKTVTLWEALENAPTALDQRRHLPFRLFAIKASTVSVWVKLGGLASCIWELAPVHTDGVGDRTRCRLHVCLKSHPQNILCLERASKIQRDLILEISRVDIVICCIFSFFLFVIFGSIWKHVLSVCSAWWAEELRLEDT